MGKERQLYRLNVRCTVRVESDLRTSKKYFIDRRFDVTSFWADQLKKEMAFISEIKNKIRTGMHNIYPVFQPPASQFLQGILRSVKISTL